MLYYTKPYAISAIYAHRLHTAAALCLPPPPLATHGIGGSTSDSLKLIGLTRHTYVYVFMCV